MITPEEASVRPLISEADTIERLTDIVGEACNPGQLWILPLDENHCQLPIIIPVAGIPQRPTATMMHNLMMSVRETLPPAGAASIVYVLERMGSRSVTASDRMWAAAIHRLAFVSTLEVHGVYLSHSGGISVLGSADLAQRRIPVSSVRPRGLRSRTRSTRPIR
ncbi:hypothetical protein EH165_05050 [Nakamurella antarctica]|uniref:Uncharacterized protein n=1 Tax=Nakamurella antarctica TaxID=1902245 RepID=A0A3G8ZLA7_9ACTN|nr:hypothetical protein [Nakamurella antarctica]AZI57615.1 hypothetical protein EH165_05050 [Nakamurella antarctica]